MTSILIKQGAALTWAASGGDYALTLTSLANSAARQGGRADLTATFAERYGFRLTTKFASNPTAGALLRLWVGFSEDGSTFAGTLGTSDAAVSDTDHVDQLIEVRPLVCDADTNAQTVVGTIPILARYMVPVVMNESGAALSGTAGDHELVIWPLTPEV